MDKASFTTYTLNLPEGASTDDDLPQFQINLAALLEALQLFGVTEVAARAAKADAEPYHSGLRNYRPNAFSHQTLDMPGTCCLLYEEDGSPLSIILEENGVKTRSDMVTYTPDSPYEIPFDRGDISFKVITKARWLLDSLSELAAISPTQVRIRATPNAPYLTLSSSSGFGECSVNFARSRNLLEVFSVHDRWSQSFKFDFIKSATEAMRIADKVSFRGDGQGVLSLQFIVEPEAETASFLDFRFVPYVTQEDEASTSEEDAV